ncbi:hypothetical protein FHR83_004246 [Actinoplanes campanulatus]|uniref:Uncharacterized protein n=1 Tax=Actinoplanes campanulatus TaxID=113559 RepID=A0A7W5AHW1_9ACTN|nr:hypothetical protein [Actinoplanes campanulatus]MBB3096572.1 hypothetical protein [Actinoplanes campanulatus]
MPPAAFDGQLVTGQVGPAGRADLRAHPGQVQVLDEAAQLAGLVEGEGRGVEHDAQ